MKVNLANVYDLRDSNVIRIDEDNTGFDLYVSLGGRQASLTTDRASLVALQKAIAEVLGDKSE